MAASSAAVSSAAVSSVTASSAAVSSAAASSADVLSAAAFSIAASSATLFSAAAPAAAASSAAASAPVPMSAVPFSLLFIPAAMAVAGATGKKPGSCARDRTADIIRQIHFFFIYALIYLLFYNYTGFGGLLCALVCPSRQGCAPLILAFSYNFRYNIAGYNDSETG